MGFKIALICGVKALPSQCLKDIGFFPPLFPTCTWPSGAKALCAESARQTRLTSHSYLKCLLLADIAVDQVVTSAQGEKVPAYTVRVCDKNAGQAALCGCAGPAGHTKDAARMRKHDQKLCSEAGKHCLMQKHLISGSTAHRHLPPSCAQTWYRDTAYVCDEMTSMVGPRGCCIVPHPSRA